MAKTTHGLLKPTMTQSRFGQRSRFVGSSAAILMALHLISGNTAIAQELYDLGGGAGYPTWRFDAAEGAVHVDADGRKLDRAMDHFTKDQRGYVRILLSASNTADKSAKLETDSNRSITSSRFKVTEDCKLAIYAYLTGDLLRKDNGEVNVEATIRLRNITDGGDAFTISQATDANRWKYEIKANADQKLDDTLFALADLKTGKEYEVVAQIRSKVLIPEDKKGEVRFRIRDTGNTNELFFNIVIAPKPLRPKAWRESAGIDAVNARKKYKVGDKALSGDGVRVGIFELERPITDHKHLPRVNIAQDGTNFKDADKVPARGEHATAVAGVIGSDSGDDRTAGVAPKCIMWCLANNTYQFAENTDERKRLMIQRGTDELLKNNARTINHSWGYRAALTDQDEARRLNRYLDEKVSNDKTVFVISAGNRKDGFFVTPQEAECMIRVSALDRSFRRVADFSTVNDRRDSGPHICAPGEWIDTTIVVPRTTTAGKERRSGDLNDYDSVFQGFWLNGRGAVSTNDISGTSFAAPMVTGTVALMREFLTDAKFNRTRGEYDDGEAFRAVLMAAAWVGQDGDRLKYKDGGNVDPARDFTKRQGQKVWREIGAGLLWSERTLRIMDKRLPIFRNLNNPDPEQEPSDPPGSDSPARMKFSGKYFVDTFDIESGQQQEFAIPGLMKFGDEAVMALSWPRRWQSDSEFTNLDLAVALYKDNDYDPDNPNDRIGSADPITGITFDDGGAIFPESLGADTLVMSADGAWNTAEKLYYQITSGGDEGFYYFRVVNLSSYKDNYSFAGFVGGASEGACCLPDESCANFTETECADAGGTFGGNGSRCGSVECAAKLEACCFGTVCAEISYSDCLTGGGEWRGGSCTPNPCVATTGACCLSDDTCGGQLSADECSALGGDYVGDGSDCGAADCPTPPTGACCGGDGACVQISATDCLFSFGGVYYGDGVDCGNVTCNPPTGACCLPSGSCTEMTESQCTAAGGEFGGPGSLCNTSPKPQIVVTNLQNDGTVVSLNGADGGFERIFADADSGIVRPNGIAADSAGNIYLASVRTDQVIRFDGLTAAASLTYTGGLDAPVGIAVHEPDTLFVVSQLTNSVFAFDLASGAMLDERIAPGAGGLDQPGWLLLGPDSTLLVCSENSNQILEYDLASGAFIRVVVADAAPLEVPACALFGPSGELLVTSAGDDSVLRYDYTTGEYLGKLVESGSGGLSLPVGMLLVDDQDLLVASRRNGQILRFDGRTGAFLGVFSSAGELTNPQYFVGGSISQDCNENGVPDACEISSGSVSDENGNGVPDECEEPGAPCNGVIRGDSNGDGAVDFDDIDCFVAALISEGNWNFCGNLYDPDDRPQAYICANDIDLNASVDFNDIDGFVQCLIDSGCE